MALQQVVLQVVPQQSKRKTACQAEDQTKRNKSRTNSANLRKIIRKLRRQGSFLNVEPTPKLTCVEFPLKEHVQSLRETARWLVRPGVGILAADDTLHQIDAKLEEIKLVSSNLNRHKYHELLLGAGLELGDYLSGFLMREEVISHDLVRGKKLVHMIAEQRLKLGIRLDRGAVPLTGSDGEYTTCGLDTLDEDCGRVKTIGAEFALWRCVYKISGSSPTRLAIMENSRVLARFAVQCQKHGLLPIVSADLLPDGGHSALEAWRSLKEVLTGLVTALTEHHVFLEGTLVRVAAATPGTFYVGPRDLTSAAMITARVLNQCLPPALGGVLLAREDNLNRSLAILNEFQNCPLKKPFFMSFCFSRVIQNDVVSMWAGQDKNLHEARTELVKRLECCSLATFGQCSGRPKSMFSTVEYQL